MKQVRVTALAEEDLLSIRDRYEAEREGLGTRFVDRFGELARKVGEQPRSFAIVDSDARRAQMPPFPHGIYFRETETEILILAVVHLRRHPSSWRHSR